MKSEKEFYVMTAKTQIKLTLIGSDKVYTLVLKDSSRSDGLSQMDGYLSRVGGQRVPVLDDKGNSLFVASQAVSTITPFLK